MEVGKIKIADEADFDQLIELCQVHTDWTQVYNKGMARVWTRKNEVSDFNLVKIRGDYSDVCACTVYDVLHDPHYRPTWDPNILEGKEICRVNEWSDVGYYAMKLPKPLANRDFVTQRSWSDRGTEKLILNHSVNHASMPPRRGIVRGVSYMTGYHITSNGPDPTKPGCQVTYVTQSDPKGKLPTWVVNKATQWLAPKVIGKLHGACLLYNDWKKVNRPEYKPWLYPEQSALPYLETGDITAMQKSETDPDLLSESNAAEDNFTEEYEP